MKNLIVGALIVVAATVIVSSVTSNLEIQGHPDTNICVGECYADYVAANGNIVEQEKRRAEAAASMSPAELGKTAFMPCQACHGADASGGVGPRLLGNDASFIVDALHTYKANGTRGTQSAMMWGIAAPLSDTEIDNLAAYIDSL